MINFDAMDFSERRSEEVSLFWRSVYIGSTPAIVIMTIKTLPGRSEGANTTLAGQLHGMSE